MGSQEHMAKETLKYIVDNSPGYTGKMKSDLKAMIDAAKSPEELAKAFLTYFASFNW